LEQKLNRGKTEKLKYSEARISFSGFRLAVPCFSVSEFQRCSFFPSPKTAALETA
jgi:hypothetical protein